MRIKKMNPLIKQIKEEEQENTLKELIDLELTVYLYEELVNKEEDFISINNFLEKVLENEEIKALEDDFCIKSYVEEAIHNANKDWRFDVLN